jgi:hypothetical protein
MTRLSKRCPSRTTAREFVSIPDESIKENV